MMKRILSFAVATALLAPAYALPLQPQQINGDGPSDAIPVVVAGDVAPLGIEFNPALTPIPGSDDLSEGVLRPSPKAKRWIARVPFDDDDDDEDNVRDIGNLQGWQTQTPRMPAGGEENQQSVLLRRRQLDEESDNTLVRSTAQDAGQSPAEAPRDPPPVDPPVPNGMPAEPEQDQQPEEEPPEPDTSDEERDSLQQQQQQEPEQQQQPQQQPQRRHAQDPDDDEEPVPLPIKL